MYLAHPAMGRLAVTSVDPCGPVDGGVVVDRSGRVTLVEGRVPSPPEPLDPQPATRAARVRSTARRGSPKSSHRHMMTGGGSSRNRPQRVMLRSGSTGSIRSISKSEPTIRSTTLEVRWICRGGVPPGLLDYLGPFREAAEVREDRYLVDPWFPLLGVKIRGGASLDIKVSQGSAGEVHLANAASGRLEHWTKWTFPINFDRRVVARVGAAP